ncbi:MAG: ABC transporter ATP-binding protein [Propionivibrio sp.]
MAPPAPLLEVRQLTVGIGGKIFCQNLDLTLRPGERLAILGRNGAGKSTLLSVLAGLRAPLAGEVLINGVSYAELGVRRSALVRGWLPQTRGDAFASTVLETALVGRHPHVERWGWETEKDARIVRDALAAVGLSSFEQRDIQTLSGGERQRLAIATLLAQAPQLFLLDEPVAYLDLNHQIAILELFATEAREQNATIAMVLHEPALAWRFCDRALLLHADGETESGMSHEMLTVERLSRLYQHPLQVLQCDERIAFVPR